MGGMPGMEMGMGAAPPMGDPIALFQALQALVGASQPPAARYPAWYKKPPKPAETGIWGKAQEQKQRFQHVRARMEDDLLWLRMQLVGMFPEDIQAKHIGLIVDEFRDTGLVSEWNMVCAFLAGLPLQPRKTVLGDNLSAEAQMIRDAVTYLRREEEARHSMAGNGPLAMDEARMLTAYGQIVNRTVIDLSDPEFPFDSTLIDPSTVFPEWHGKRGLYKVHRVYTSTASRLFGDYGEPPRSQMKKLKNRYGNDIDDRTELEVVEYWDTWYRSVQCDDCTVVPVKAHEYGVVPYTIQYGPLGEPMATLGSMNAVTDIAVYERSGQYVAEKATYADDLAHKAVSYIHYLKTAHQQYEAVMARFVTAFKKSVNPPLLRERDEAAAEKPIPEMDTGPGAVNETMLGHEKVSPIPTTPNPVDAQALVAAVQEARMKLSLPPLMSGHVDKSNVSGTAVNSLSDAGLDRISPWVATLERYHGRRFSQWLGFWRNFGHLASYTQDGPPQPFMVPRSRVRDGESPAFELTQDVIDRVGSRVEIKMTKLKKQDWLPFLTAGKQAFDLGVITKRAISDELGNDDYDHIRDENMEDKALDMAMSHPKFAEFFTIPQALEAEIEEAAGDPAKQDSLKAALQAWMDNIAMPALQPPAPPQQPGVPGQPAPGGPPIGPPMGPPPEAMQGDPMAPTNPPTAAGMSYPATGQGPGSVTGATGRPPGNPYGY